MGKGQNNSPACASVRHISECFIKPNLDEEEKKKLPIYLAPWDIIMLNFHYIQKGLLFAQPLPSSSSSHDTPTLLRDLKEALSAALAHFYPLAGQLETQTFLTEDTNNNNGLVIFIDPCKGPGARFIHATLDLTVSDLISPPNHDDDVGVTAVVQSLFDHHKAINYDGHTRPLLSVQVTELVDGIFIGCSMSHSCVDGTSYWHFWNSWSEIATKLISRRGGDPPFAPLTLSRPPIHTRFFIDGSGTGGFKLPFTHPDQFIVRFDSPDQLKERFFRFSSESIRKNKARANREIANIKADNDDDNSPNATTRTTTTMISSFQALSALVWRCVIRARLRCNRLQAPDQETTCKLAINNRPRLDPPLSENYFGNSVQMVQASCKAEQLMEQSLGWAAMRLNRAVAAHDDKAVRGSLERWMRAPQVFGPGSICDPGAVTIGSSPRFDMYGNEFGVLGKPVCVLTGYANKFDGKVSSFPGREGGGSVDLEICLLPDIMCALESDEEFMSVVTA